VKFLLLASNAFQYKLTSQEITAPEMFCFSGDATSQFRDRSLPCPTTPDEVANYPAVVMDEAGYVTVKIPNIIMRDDGRRRHDIQIRNEEDEAGYDNWNKKKGKGRNLKNRTEIIVGSENVVQEIATHHLQVYLVALDTYSPLVNTSHCCYEMVVHKLPFVPSENECYSTSSTLIHDYRLHAPRIGKTATVSAPMKVNTYENPVDIVTKLRPTSRGRHMIVVSNCAAELSIDPYTNTTTAKGIKAIMQDGLEITFVSKFGELPLSMMGIIPFYGVLMAFYGILSLFWRWKWRVVYTVPTSMLGLQKAIEKLILSQFIFCAIAFAYYLHLNSISVDVEVLYSGTAAALINWGPWSIIVALAHFCTIFGCQCVVTLATDGTWLIQNNIRASTKTALYILCAMWLLYSCVYGFMTIQWRRHTFILGGFIWILFLMFNLRRSLKHLKSLVVGQSEDVVLAIGGAIVAKRSLYRKMFTIVWFYPLIFLLSLFLTSRSREDSWAWVGYVLGDIYLFIILLHATYIWMPRPMASQEYVKYEPIEVDVVNESDVWEEDVDGDIWDNEEIIELPKR